MPEKVISRRALLQRVGIALAAIPVSVLLPPHARAQGQSRIAERLHALTEEESVILRAMVARIIPSDDNGPGALEAQADRYIDRALAGALSASRPAYTAGLAAVDAYARSTRGAAFAGLPAADQDAILMEMQDNRAPGFAANPAQFFNLVRTHTIQGTFTDPYYGGNANFIGWDMIGYPGVRVAVPAEYQRMGTGALQPNHQSAYDSAMFSKGEF